MCARIPGCMKSAPGTECDREVGAPAKRHKAPTAGSANLFVRGSRQGLTTKPRRNAPSRLRQRATPRKVRPGRALRDLAVSLVCHAAITNWMKSAGSEGPDLHFHTRSGPAWTPLDGLYNLCHVVPRDGPRIRTGRCSGPSKRYCSVSVLPSVTGSHLHLSRSVTRPLRDLPMPPPREAGPPRPASRATSSSSSRSCARPTWRAGDPAPRCRRST